MQRKSALKSSPDVQSGSLGSEDERSSLSKKSIFSSRRESDHQSLLDVPLHPEKCLKPREYILLLVEASLSLAAFVIETRNIARKDYFNITYYQFHVYTQYAEGYSVLLSMFIGCIADSWLGHYTAALYSVILHFAAVCVVVMDEVVRNSQKHNPYTYFVWNVSVAAMVLIASSNFTRLVYGLEGMTNRKKSTIFMFIFLQFWVSSYATKGGFFVNVCSALFLHFGLNDIIAAFVMTGLSLFLFVYLLSPDTDAKENRGLGCRVVGCFLLASYYKVFRIKKGRRGFLENTQGTFKRRTISRTKELLLMYIIMLPTFGIAFNTVLPQSIFYRNMVERIKTKKYIETVGLQQLARAILTIGMLISYFVLWPFLILIGFKDKQSIKFLVGHFIAVLSFFYAAILMKSIEAFSYPPGCGFVRVFNTRENSVRLTSEDPDFMTDTFTVEPKTAKMVSFPIPTTTISAMRFDFNGTNTSFVTFLAIKRYQTIGYVVLDPPEVVRIRGPYLPLRDGPPGTNTLGAKIFIYNTDKSLDGSSMMIKYAHNKKKVIREVLINTGTMTTIGLTPGLYYFTILQGGIEKTVNIEQGALYGFTIYATTTSREIAVDNVIGPNTAPAWPYFGLYLVLGLANGISYPSMRAMIFTIAPHGLLAMSFAFLSSLEGLSLWFTYIGIIAWHPYVIGNIMFFYAAGLFIFFLFCSYIILKYNNSYTA